MSKDLHNNERYLKELANKHKPVPPPVVWDEIEQVLDKDKGKRRPFFILWIFGILVVGAIMFFNLRVKKDMKSPIIEQEIIISDYQKQRDPNSQDIRSVDSETINEVKQGQNANFSETILTVSDNQEGNKADSEKLKSFVTQQQQLNNFNTSGVDRSLNTNINTNTNSNTNTNTNSINSNPTAIITKEEAFRPKMSTQSTQGDKNSIKVTPLQNLKWTPRPLVSMMLLPDPSEKLTVVPISRPKHNTLLFSPWFVELGGGIGKNLSNPELINPTQGGLRLNTESSWYAWSSSIQVGYQFDNLWYTTVGFDLNQTKNRFDFWRRNISSLVVSENQSFEITNTDFFTNGEIRYTFLDVGLSLGRRINIDYWHFSLEGGPIFNVLFNANGKVQVGDLEFSRLEDQGGYFNTQLGIGARLSAMVDYPISDHLWISVGPVYHQYFNALSSDENSLKERNSILQLKAKVRYHF